MESRSAKLATISTSPTKIPRPLNSFMIFRLEKQREIVDQCPGANHRDISKIISKWWKDLSAEDKQKYVAEADKLKMEHRQLYPNYKYCPQKKTRKTRAYRKRSGNEFSARDIENKQSLYALYQGSSKSRLSKRLSSCYDSKSSRPTSYKNNLDPTASLHPSSSSYPYYTVSPASLQLNNDENNGNNSKVNHTSYATHQSLPLFPVTTYYQSPIASVIYSVPSQRFSCSSSPCSTSDTSSSTSEDTCKEPFVNYNIYNRYYDPPEVVHSTYPCVIGGNVTTLHYMAPNHQYPPPAAHYYINTANSTINYSNCLHPHDSKNQNPHTTSAPPNLLTQPFYYQS